MGMSWMKLYGKVKVVIGKLVGELIWSLCFCKVVELLVSEDILVV